MPCSNLSCCAVGAILALFPCNDINGFNCEITFTPTPRDPAVFCPDCSAQQQTAKISTPGRRRVVTAAQRERRNAQLRAKYALVKAEKAEKANQERIEQRAAMTAEQRVKAARRERKNAQLRTKRASIKAEKQKQKEQEQAENEESPSQHAAGHANAVQEGVFSPRTESLIRQFYYQRAGSSRAGFQPDPDNHSVPWNGNQVRAFHPTVQEPTSSSSPQPSIQNLADPMDLHQANTEPQVITASSLLHHDPSAPHSDSDATASRELEDMAIWADALLWDMQI